MEETRRKIWVSEEVEVSNLTKAEAYINEFREDAKKEAGELQPNEEWKETHSITGKIGHYKVSIRMEIVTT